MIAVNWEPVHQLLIPVLARVDSWPLVGSLDWMALDDTDPSKWAAVLDGGQHWALRLEGNQRALGEASKAVAASTDWRKVASEIQGLANFRASRPWARRGVEA